MPQHVVVATDLSEASIAALDAGRLWANTFGARLTLLHVYSPDVMTPGLGPIEGVDPGREHRIQIGKALHEALNRLSNKELRVANTHVELVADSSAANAVCRFAEEHGADLIIVSSHGRTGVAHLLLGSVAEKIMRHAPCPVLVARAPREGDAEDSEKKP